ncbi:site-specific tyrosine recombinase [Bacillus phage vB_BcoS-136]|uniref:Integrase n=1 Tax=Bacillus phage vB_BcoS-136 TaxID=2419619 RepID=A0A3G3BVE5_9CAUD|nr:site-specific tyrosine recombinase [Bacillus phage vB_BcoS-136]AYP68232.1 site-specific tyrosine recombinase [Bacillus phage vB_BcoS-136]
MSAINNKVVQFNAKEDKNVWTCIKTFLDRKGQDSKNTRDTYERAIRDFFRKMRNKELEDLIEEDLIFTKPQIETYQVGIRNDYKATTVNNKMSALKRCYEKLEDYGFNVKSSWFDLDRYTEYDKERYDTLSHEEICKIIELVSKTRKGFEKGLLVRLAYATAFRKQSLLDLKWTDIINREGVWFIKTLGKGNKWDYKKISNELYDELMKQKELVGGEKIFQLTDKTVKKMMDYIRKNIDFGDRKIVFHSFKKASINEVNIITGGDIKAMQRQGNHASATTTLNDYLASKELDDLVIVDTNKNIPVEKFDEMSKEELVDLIRSMDRNIQIKLLQKMGAM